MMDNLSIPACAMYRQIGTVIVKTEDLECCRSRYLDNSPADFVRTPAKCEKCEWTRTINKYSECDSDVVEKSRPYRSSAARSRYVNVCAAVCLLLLVGGLSPQSSAAPHRRVKMERQRRAAQENNLWGNPCDYADGSSKTTKEFSKEDVKRVANQARSALSIAESFKDKVARVLHDNSEFEAVRAQYEATPWLHSDKFQSFMRPEILPKDKTKLNEKVSLEFLDQVVLNIDSYLPSMQKALKMLVAGLDAVKKHGLNMNYVDELSLQSDFDVTMNQVRQVLCVFNEVMETRKVEAIPLPDSEVPTVTTDRVATAFLIYRDTLLYLDYLSQVMDVWQ